jgi:5,10-methylenetetrahydromethanopterin reductase
VDFTCSYPPGPRSVDWAREAEQFGYRRVYLHDSPALYWDVWATLAAVAQETRHIGLGALVIPSVRPVLTTASAIATIEHLAPGRLVVVVGTGFTARAMLGRRPLQWSEVHSYIRDLQALLRGEIIEHEGSAVAMRHPDGWAPPRPIEVPIVVAANGPKGLDVARAVGQGVFGMVPGISGFDPCIFGTAGTVLQRGESLASPRVFDALGPAIALNYHFAYEMGGADAVDELPRGKEWRESVETVDVAERHLALHDGHGVAPNARELPFLEPSLAQFTTTGTPEELRIRFAEYEAAGITELAYAPMGSRIPDELRAMADVAGIAP